MLRSFVALVALSFFALAAPDGAARAGCADPRDVVLGQRAI
jgi:hypothetical protein